MTLSEEEERSVLDWVKEGRVYNATLEELQNFDLLIANIEKRGYFRFGAVRVIPPEDYTHCTLSEDAMKDHFIEDPYKMNISKIASAGGNYFEFTKGASRANEVKIPLPKFKKDSGLSPELQKLCFVDLEKEYWRTVRKKGATKRNVHLATYGSDKEGSLMKFGAEGSLSFSDMYTILERVLHKYEKVAPGISSSMLYFGAWLTTFVNHLEDKDLWSISYLHHGASKVWYCNYPEDARQIEAIVNRDLQDYIKINHNCPSIFRHKSVLTDIKFFKDNNIPVSRHVQEKGQFMILPPMTYHFGWNSGYNLAEARNFATESWLNIGLLARECNHKSMGPKINMEFFVYEHMHQEYQNYLNGTLEVLHPIEKTVQKVQPPIPVIYEDPIVHHTNLRYGVIEIMAFKTSQDVQLCYTEVQDHKMWLTRKDVESLVWKKNFQAVKVPDHYFSQEWSYPPPSLMASPVRLNKGQASMGVQVQLDRLEDNHRPDNANGNDPGELHRSSSANSDTPTLVLHHDMSGDDGVDEQSLTEYGDPIFHQADVAQVLDEEQSVEQPEQPTPLTENVVENILHVDTGVGESSASFVTSLISSHSRIEMSTQNLDLPTGPPSIIIPLSQPGCIQNSMVCLNCNKDLNKHMKHAKNRHRHIVECGAKKTFKCVHCEREFSASRYLNGHLIRCNRNPSKPVKNRDSKYPCPRCQKRFTEKRYMKTHLKKCNNKKSL